MSNHLAILSPNFKRVGVFVSGGVDSALLYYQLVKEAWSHSIIPMCCPKLDGADHYAEIVVDWVSKKAGVNPAPILYIGNPHDRHDLIVRNAIVRSLTYKIVDCVFLADTTNPPAMLDGLEPQRERARQSNVLQPFFDLTKDRIIKKFYEEGIQDLLAQTHSCTERPRGACWKCWQCNERKWAFKQLGQVDPLLHLS